MAIKHVKVATVPDDGISEVGTDEWNDNHTIEDNTITNDHLTGSIAQSKITNLTTDLTSKAPIASPTFTGTVVLPNVPAVVTTQLNLKAPLNSPTLTTPNIGTPSDGVLTNCTGLPATTGLTATGTKDSTTYLRGDNTWAVVSGYDAPIIGSTSIASGSTNATIAGLTLTTSTITAPTFDSYTDMDVITIPSDPASGKGRVYVKTIDANNDGIFIKLKRGGSYVEVQIA
jgi:hypothetical protein